MKKYKSIHNPYLKMVAELLSTGSYLDSRVSAILKEHGITHVQFNILRILQGADDQPLSPGQISERLMFKNSDVTRLLDRLEKRGLVTRHICPENRRKMDIRLHENGLELIRTVLPLIEKELNGFFKNVISPEDRDHLLNTLKKIKAA